MEIDLPPTDCRPNQKGTEFGMDAHAGGIVLWNPHGCIAAYDFQAPRIFAMGFCSFMGRGVRKTGKLVYDFELSKRRYYL